MKNIFFCYKNEFYNSLECESLTSMSLWGSLVKLILHTINTLPNHCWAVIFFSFYPRVHFKNFFFNFNFKQSRTHVKFTSLPILCVQSGSLCQRVSLSAYRCIFYVDSHSLVTDSGHLAYVLQGSFILCYKNFLLFLVWMLFRCMHIPYCLYSSLRICRFLPPLGCCECSRKHKYENISLPAYILWDCWFIWKV